MMKMIFLLSMIAGIVLLISFQFVIPGLCRTDNSAAGSKSDVPRLKDGRLCNVGRTLKPSFTGFVSNTWDYLFGGHDRTPGTTLPSTPVDLDQIRRLNKDELSVTWLGHSSLMITISGHTLLLDPVFETSISMIGPSRLNGDTPLNPNDLNHVDAVMISHDHYDHLNQYSVRALKEKTGVFIVPVGVGTLLLKWGVDPGKIVELNWWEEYQLDDSLRVAATPSQHFSGRGLGDRNKRLWCSWVIAGLKQRLYFSGDSGYFDGFKTIGRIYGPFDITFVECGAYNTSWASIHMFPEQSIQAHLDLGGKILHPIHWGTFNLAPHPWFEPMERLSAAAEAAGVVLVTPVAGGTMTGKGHPSTVRWWKNALDIAKD